MAIAQRTRNHEFYVGGSITVELEVVVKKPHRGGMIPDYHEFVWLGDTKKLDTLGREHRHAWRLWAVLLCNNPECGGQAAVDMTVLCDKLLESQRTDGEHTTSADPETPVSDRAQGQQRS